MTSRVTPYWGPDGDGGYNIALSCDVAACHVQAGLVLPRILTADGSTPYNQGYVEERFTSLGWLYVEGKRHLCPQHRAEHEKAQANLANWKWLEITAADSREREWYRQERQHLERVYALQLAESRPQSKVEMTVSQYQQQLEFQKMVAQYQRQYEQRQYDETDRRALEWLRSDPPPPPPPKPTPKPVIKELKPEPLLVETRYAADRALPEPAPAVRLTAQGIARPYHWDDHAVPFPGYRGSATPD